MTSERRIYYLYFSEQGGIIRKEEEPIENTIFPILGFSVRDDVKGERG